VLKIKKEIIYREKDGTVRMRKETIYPDKFDDELGYQFWVRKQAAKIFAGVPYPKAMSDSDIGKITRLAKHMYRDSNILAYRGNGGMRPYDVAGIGKLIGLGERQAFRFVARMIKLGIMAKAQMEIGDNTEVHYFISPIYYFSGKRLNHTLYILFRDQLDKVLDPWVVQRFNGYTGEVRSYAGEKVH
jgi:hypothetical protein